MYEEFYNFTLAQLISRQGEKYANHVYLQLDDQRLTYREVDQQSTALAVGLVELGLSPGDRIGIMLPNLPEFVIAWFAAAKTGMILVPVNVRRSLSDCLMRLSKTMPGAFITDISPDRLEIALQAKNDIQGLKELIFIGEKVSGGHHWDEILTTGEHLTDWQANPADPAVIVHTLGSSATPRGAVLTQSGMIRNAADLANILKIDEADSLLGMLPFSNTFGLTAHILLAMVAGARLVCLPHYRPADALRLIEQEEITVHHGVPTMFAMELNLPEFSPQICRTLRAGIMGGAACPPVLVKRVREEMGFNVMLAYGLTEASPGVTITRLDAGPIIATETVGQAMPDVEIRVIDRDGKALPHGEEGQLCARGYNIMREYWDDPAATAEVLNDDGWLRTGDLAIIDPDGPVKIIGRIGEVINRSGFSVYPGTVEMVFRTHPDIKEVAVFGTPDLIYSELIVVCVVGIPGAELDADAILDYVNQQLPEYAHPDRLFILESLPRRGDGQVHKAYLRDRMRIRGLAWRFGKNIDTDAIIPARRCNTSDPAELAKYCMEDADSDFVHKMSRGDLIVAETNFGCGSSREVAPLTIKAAGVSAVIARSFARIFFRNAINIGLPILECPEAVERIREGDEIDVEPITGLIYNVTRDESYQAEPFPDFLQHIINKGGLLAYVEDRLQQGGN